jgi:hypothetical protein
MDCAVACLAMLFGLAYEDVLIAFTHHVITEGATIRQVKAAARRLQRKLVWSRKLGDLDADMGVLAVRSDRWHTDHLVVLKEGLIIDTDATIWDYDVFLSVYAATPVSILRLES